MKRISDLWNDIKYFDKCVSRALEGEEKKTPGKKWVKCCQIWRNILTFGSNNCSESQVG